MQSTEVCLSLSRTYGSLHEHEILHANVNSGVHVMGSHKSLDHLQWNTSHLLK